MRKQIVSIAAVCAALISAPANALFGVGGIVIDPSNLVQNTASAAAAVKNEINTATALIHQIKAAIDIAKSLQSVNGLANLAGLQQELALYQQLKSTSTNMQSVLNESLRLSQSIESRYGASSSSWSEFIATKNASNNAIAKVAASQYQTIDDSLEQIAQRRQNIVNQLEKSEGPTQAMAAVGAGVDTLIGQNQLMISTLKMQGQLQSETQQANEDKHQKTVDAYARRQQQMVDQDAKYRNR